jgi:hypothetical protein
MLYEKEFFIVGELLTAKKLYYSRSPAAREAFSRIN